MSDTDDEADEVSDAEEADVLSIALVEVRLLVLLPLAGAVATNAAASAVAADTIDA